MADYLNNLRNEQRSTLRSLGEMKTKQKNVTKKLKLKNKKRMIAKFQEI